MHDATLNRAMSFADRKATTLKLRSTRLHAGHALAELIVGLGVLMTTLLAAFQVNGVVLNNVRILRETSAASDALVQLKERLRAAPVGQVVTDSYLSGTILGAAPALTSPLEDLQITVQLSAWPADGNGATQVQRVGTAVSVGSINALLPAAPMVRADISLHWTGPRGIARTREGTIFLAKGGLGS